MQQIHIIHHPSKLKNNQPHCQDQLGYEVQNTEAIKEMQKLADMERQTKGLTEEN